MCLHYIRGASASSFPSENQNVQVRQLLGKKHELPLLSECSSECLRNRELSAPQGTQDRVPAERCHGKTTDEALVILKSEACRH